MENIKLWFNTWLESWKSKNNIILYAITGLVFIIIVIMFKVNLWKLNPFKKKVNPTARRYRQRYRTYRQNRRTRRMNRRRR